jgi:hypothetical protein
MGEIKLALQYWKSIVFASLKEVGNMLNLRDHAKSVTNGVILWIALSLLATSGIIAKDIEQIFKGDLSSIFRFIIMFILIFAIPLFLLNLVYQPAKINKSKDDNIQKLKDLYESEDPKIRIEELNTDPKTQEFSGLVIYNKNPNIDIIDITVTLTRLVEHKSNKYANEIGAILIPVYANNCHFTTWANGINKVLAQSQNVLYMTKVIESNSVKKHPVLILSEEFILENHSEFFETKKEVRLEISKHELFFDITGKIDGVPKKTFKQSFRAEFYFTRMENISSYGEIINREIYFGVKNIIRIADLSDDDIVVINTPKFIKL